MQFLGDIFAHVGHISITCGSYFNHDHRIDDFQQNMTSYMTVIVLLGSIAIILASFDISFMLGFLTILEFIILINHYIDPSLLLLQLFDQYYFSLITCSLCSLLAFHHSKQYTSHILIKMALFIIHLQLFLIIPIKEMNLLSFLLCFTFAIFLYWTKISISGFESILFYWSIFTSSKWVLDSLYFETLKDVSSMELINLIGSSGLLLVLSLGMNKDFCVSHFLRNYFDFSD